MTLRDQVMARLERLAAAPASTCGSAPPSAGPRSWNCRTRVRIRGTIAWVAWLALHLVPLLGNRNRLSAQVNLAYRYLTWGHGGAVIVDSDPPLPGLGSAQA